MRWRFPVAALFVVAFLLCDEIPVEADDIRGREWIVASLQLDAVHRIADGNGVVVAVVDTGVQAGHIDLKGNVLPGIDLSSGAPTGAGTLDVDGHGTAMASLIAGHGHGVNHQDGVVGIAPEARILPLRDGVHKPRYIAQAVDWAVDHGAAVISISEGQSVADPELTASIQRAVRADVVVVAAVGNHPIGLHVSFPAALPGVLAVAGTDRAGNHASASISGSQVLISAPSTNIVSAYLGSAYGIGSGTSYSAAIVAGAAALLRERFPSLSAADVIRRIEDTAIDKGSPGRDNEYGYGVLNILAALTTVVPLPHRLPSSGTQPATPKPMNASGTDDAAAGRHGSDERGMRGLALAGLVGLLLALCVVALARRAGHT